MAQEAEKQAKSAEAKVAATERLREDVDESAKRPVRRQQRDASNGSLESHSKAELLDLAASIDIEGRTNMSKAELISAINKASRAKR
jgi:hypothetical protein